MSWTLTILPRAEKDLRGVPAAACVEVRNHVRQLREDPWPAGVVKLRGGQRSLYRIRVDDFRVIYDVDEARRVVRVVAIGNRRDVYARLARRELD